MREEPKLGDVIYLVLGGEIYEQTVYAKGKHTFLCDDYKEVKAEFVEHRYDSFGDTWFYNFYKACEKLCGDDESKKLVHGANDWWYLG